MPFTPKTNFPILTKRIPTFPFGDEKQRHIVPFDEYVKTGGYEGLRKALTMAPDAVTEEVKKSQLRGRGGAGFPCGLKWTFLPKLAPGQDPGQRYLAVNADESEPGTFKDRLLMDFDPHLMLEGIAIACYACRIRTAYIFIRGEYHHQAHVTEQAIREAYEHGVFGKGGGRDDIVGAARQGNPSGLPFAVDCYLHRGAGAYICGEETGLLEALEGKRGWPRIKPPFPAIKGAFGKPTIINNVETLAHLPSIIEHGWEWFSKQGCDSTVGGPPSWGTKLMGVSGHVNRPGCFECDLGIKLADLVNHYSGGMRHGKKFKGAIAGGVSMGILGPDQFDAEMDFDIGRKYNVLGLGTACPTIFDEDTDMVAVARNVARFFKHESCGQCTPCREGSGWLYQLLSRIEEGHARTKDLDLALEIATSMGSMPGTTICGLADGNNWAVRTIMNKYREEFEKRVKPTYVPVRVTVGAAANA
jgi:NADH-quinone oxidoreductase subunit F